jgi:hypothetical protein
MNRAELLEKLLVDSEKSTTKFVAATDTAVKAKWKSKKLFCKELKYDMK